MPKAAKAEFYAVRAGKVPGIYSTWDECVLQVTKFPNAKYKKFHTRKDAEDYLRNVNQNAPTSSSTIHSVASASTKTSTAVKVGTSAAADPRGYHVVFTDGASKGNGQVGSIAGVGVWWGHNDPRNIAERCPGAQTNNRAELIAMIRALETTPITKKPLMIRSDSQYSINCIREWLPGWKRRGWRTATGKDVLNKALIQYLSALIDHREARGQKVVLDYVKGHAGIEGNEGADMMANEGTVLPEVDEKDWDGMREKLEAQTVVKDQPAPAMIKEMDNNPAVSQTGELEVDPPHDDNFDIDLDDLFSDEEMREMERTQTFN